MNVYNIESRTRASEDFDEIIPAHTASSKELAIAWCKEHLDWLEEESTRPWCFVIVEEEVDCPNLAPIGITWISWDGEVLKDSAPDYYTRPFLAR